MARFAPEIIVSIEKDLDTQARAKKGVRLADRKFHDGRTTDLPGMDIPERNALAGELKLAVGRPRLPGYEELDDFKSLTIDSTAVKANSCWR